MRIWVLLVTFMFPGLVVCQGTNNNQTEAEEFLRTLNTAAESQTNVLAQTTWADFTDKTTANAEALVRQKSIKAQFDKDMRAAALRFNASAMSEDVRRQLKKITNIGISAEPNATKVVELANVTTQMTKISDTAKVCLNQEGCLPIQNISRILAKSRDYDRMKTLWVGFRNETGRKMRDLYPKYVQLSNEAVQHLGFNNMGEQWRSDYESDTFMEDIEDMWNQVRPLYEQLHAYVRRRLKQVYGASRFPASGHIPAHILGDMCAQMWNNLLELVNPFPDKPAMDVTPAMVRQKYTGKKIFRMAEDFFVSLGFERMPHSFWTLSMFEAPKGGRNASCQPVAFDFANRRDFRIAMCTEVNQYNLMVAHHEMGHVVYYMQYRNQPFVYRDGANHAFHEAVGDLMTLSFQTPEHLHKLGLIADIPNDNESDINFLMSMALQKVAFLPFAYLVDKWRWSVFSGQTTPATYNQDWWKLRCQLQGVSPPVPRTEEDFDPGAKFHVPASVPYIRYFLSFVIQFQFHKAACKAACYFGPLHRCDIYNNRDVGDKLRNMLQLGCSKPWPEALKLLTRQTKMSAEPMLEYFKPLLDFLRRENGNDYGWQPNCTVPT